MAEKQLSILVTARDQASAVFNQVGGSASGLTEKLEETGHGLHGMLRSARNIAIAFELLPVGVDAAKAAFETIGGTAQQAAEGQRALYEGIKGIPLVGKPAAEAAEFLGSALAHAFGRESTSDIEANIAADKKATDEFTASIKKLHEELERFDREAENIGKSGVDLKIDGYIQKAEAAEKALKDLNSKSIAAAGTQDESAGASNSMAELQKEDANLRKFLNDPAYSSSQEGIRKAIDQTEAKMRELDAATKDSARLAADAARFRGEAARLAAEESGKKIADSQEKENEQYFKGLSEQTKADKEAARKFLEEWENAQDKKAAAEKAAAHKSLEEWENAQDAKAKAAEEAGKRMHEALETPLEKYQDKLKEIAELEKAQAIDATDAARARTKAMQDLSAAGGGDTSPRLATAEDLGFQTGVRDRAEQERDQYAPVVDAQMKHMAVTQSVLDLLTDFYNAFTAPSNATPVT